EQPLAWLHAKGLVLLLPASVFWVLPTATDDGDSPIGRPSGQLRPRVLLVGQSFGQQSPMGPVGPDRNRPHRAHVGMPVARQVRAQLRVTNELVGQSRPVGTRISQASE